MCYNCSCIALSKTFLCGNVILRDQPSEISLTV